LSRPVSFIVSLDLIAVLSKSKWMTVASFLDDVSLATSLALAETLGVGD